MRWLDSHINHIRESFAHGRKIHLVGSRRNDLVRNGSSAQMIPRDASVHAALEEVAEDAVVAILLQQAQMPETLLVEGRLLMMLPYHLFDCLLKYNVHVKTLSISIFRRLR